MRTYSMGALFAIPSVANPTPVPIASIKGCKIGIKQGKVGFRGNQLDFVDVGNKGRDWSIEIEHADFRASALQMVTGGTQTTGANLVANGEALTIAATNTVANSATFVEDGGVYDLTANKWMTRVANGPAAGQYSGPAAGVYTFAAGDSGHSAIVVYSYSSASLGLTTTVSNAVQGQSTPYKLRVYNPYVAPGGSVRLIGIDFPSVHFEELDLDFKVEDFATKNLKGFASQDMIGGTLKTCVAYDSELG